jgi:hypothetical protein
MANRNKKKPSPPPVRKKEPPRRLAGIAAGEGHEYRPLWRLSLLDQDHAGSWSWEVSPETLRKIIAFLTEMERLTWQEIRAQQTGGKKRRGAKHKDIPVESLCAEAQQRLQELGIVEWECLFRFRTGNMERLWGVISDEEPRVFYPIWWDPDHRVCPSKDPD